MPLEFMMLQVLFAVFHGTLNVVCCFLLVLTKSLLYGILADSEEQLLNFKDTGQLWVYGYVKQWSTSCIYTCMYQNTAVLQLGEVADILAVAADVEDC